MVPTPSPEFSRRALLINAVVIAAVGGLPGCKKNKKDKTETPNEVMMDMFGKIKKRIKKNVPDRDRRDKALDLVEQAREVLAKVGEIQVDLRAELVRIPRPDRTTERVHAISDKYATKLMEPLRKASQMAIEMRKFITAQEWPLVFPRAAKAGGAA